MRFTPGWGFPHRNQCLIENIARKLMLTLFKLSDKIKKSLKNITENNFK